MLRRTYLTAQSIKDHPTVAITIVAAIILVLFGIYSMIPAAIFGGAAVASAYPLEWLRALLGLFIMAPAIPIIYWNMKDKLDDYLIKQHRTRKYIFWMGVTYFYLTIFRILWAGFFPPIWLIYLGFGVVMMIIWMGVK